MGPPAPSSSWSSSCALDIQTDQPCPLSLSLSNTNTNTTHRQPTRKQVKIASNNSKRNYDLLLVVVDGGGGVDTECDGDGDTNESGAAEPGCSRDNQVGTQQRDADAVAGAALRRCLSARASSALARLLCWQAAGTTTATTTTTACSATTRGRCTAATYCQWERERKKKKKEKRNFSFFFFFFPLHSLLVAFQGPQGRHRNKWRDTTAIFNHFDNLHFRSWLGQAHDRALDESGVDPNTKEARLRASNPGSMEQQFDPNQAAHYYDPNSQPDGYSYGAAPAPTSTPTSSGWSQLSAAELAAMQRGR